jgi:hypothetical protein
VKTADLQTPLLPHQQRVIDKLRASGGVVVAHGVGSGKTLTSIAAQDALGMPADVITPAPLQANYRKEMQKHLGGQPGDVRVRTYERATMDRDVNRNGLVVLDEAHKLRNPGTGVAQYVGKPTMHAQARLLLTGTPSYNQASDIAPLINIARGERVLPEDPTEFRRQFVGEKKVDPGFWNRLRGVKPGTVPTLINRKQLVDAARGYVDTHFEQSEHFPDRVDEEYDVPMSGKQHEIYKHLEGGLPWYLRLKVRAGLPMTKAEAKDLNAFATGMRQVSNSARPYAKSITDDEELDYAPKIKKMVENLKALREKDPNFRGVAYSNYLDAGIKPYSRALTRENIPHHVFTGEVTPAMKAKMVEDYNHGRTPMMLLSGSGAQGLDLKGTKALQIMESHFNNSLIEQVIGRGIRYKSHEHLSPEERKVVVQRYYATQPESFLNRMGVGKAPGAIDRYLQESSNRKSELGKEILKAFEEASAAGPLQKRGMDDTLARFGLKTAMSPAGAAALMAALTGTAAGASTAHAQKERDWKQVGKATAMGGALGGLAGYAGAKGVANQANLQGFEEGTRLKTEDLGQALRNFGRQG